MEKIVDTANFVKYFTTSPAALSTPHLYISALATWSKDSFISQTWIKQFPFIPSLIHIRGNTTMPLMAIHAPANSYILSVAFSRDDSQIVSGSNEGVVQVWDALTGAELQQLNGCTGWVYSVAFSYDGTHIVSGSSSDCQGFTPNVLWIKFSIFIIKWILRKLPIFLHNLVDILYTYISTL